MRVVAPVPASDARAVFLSWQPQQLTELWNLTGTHIHLASNSVGSHSYAQVLTAVRVLLPARVPSGGGHSVFVCTRVLAALPRRSARGLQSFYCLVWAPLCIPRILCAVFRRC